MHYSVRVSLDLEKLSIIGFRLKKFDNLTSQHHTYINFNTYFKKLGKNVLNVPVRVHKHPVLYVIAIVFFFCWQMGSNVFPLSTYKQNNS